jgi:hypothetical protein
MAAAGYNDKLLEIAMRTAGITFPQIDLDSVSTTLFNHSLSGNLANSSSKSIRCAFLFDGRRRTPLIAILQ